MAINRISNKKIYLEKLIDCQKRIIESQQENGCFQPEKFRQEFPNSRWQEAVVTLAWAQKKLGKNYLKAIEKGLNYWLSVQNSNGSFPEGNRSESFAATAFSSIAVTETLELIGNKINTKLKERIIGALKKSTKYLTANDNKGKTNLECAAALALKKMQKFFEVPEKEIEKKIAVVLKNKTESGFFKEDNGVDFAYSSLTCEMLFLLDKKEECKKFVENQKYLIFPDGSFHASFSRLNSWLTPSFLEFFGLTDCFPVMFHLPDLRHVMTDSYRLCLAIDYAKQSKKQIIKEPNDWVKFFPEKILIVRKPDYKAVFYLSEKFLYSIWFKEGLIVNTVDNRLNNTLIEDKFTAQEFDDFKFYFNKEQGTLEIQGKCKTHLKEKNFLQKVIAKISRPKIKKTFKFNKNSIEVKVRLSDNKTALEQLPVIGKVKVSPKFDSFKADSKKLLVQSIFYGRKDFWIMRKEFKESLEYILGG
ncbi:MAG: hypothetical protein ABH821_02395 [archaeon]